MSQELEGIAIIGMSGRFPGADDLDRFWQALAGGVESITHFSDEELLAAGIPASVLQHPDYVKAGSYLEDIDLFDAPFFGISPREAELMDPQHRLFLEDCWLALEDAGWNGDRYDGQVGVFGGSSLSTYLLFHLKHDAGHVGALQTVLGNDKDYLCTRVSYKMGLKGPSVGVQTACSTSLAAVSLACDSLLNYQCDLALAGGVTVKLPQKTGYFYEKGSILSPDGHCRTFDARAQGTVFGSGAAVVVLKRLAEAVSDRDTIHAVIKGSAVNNDGDRKVGYTASSVDGQARVIAMAHAAAGVSPETISYVEAHGTGTPIGDPIEVAALAQAFRAGAPRRGSCGIGSVKTNVGHLESAAGVAGLIKTVLALKHGQLPPSLHFTETNPEIDFANSPFYVVNKLREWKSNGTPRRAGINSFGMGGTNAHVVLEEAPAVPPPVNEIERPRHLLALSAKSEVALRQQAVRFADHLQSHELSLADACFTANAGRRHFAHRLAVTAESMDELIANLRGAKPEGATPAEDTRSVAFLFTGQGSQYPGMALELWRTEPGFRKNLSLSDEILRPHLGQSILPGESFPIHETAFTQPALVASSTRWPSCGGPGASSLTRSSATAWANMPRPVSQA